MSTVKSVPLKLRRIIFFDNSSKNMALLIVIVRSICPDKSNAQQILTDKVGSLDFATISTFNFIKKNSGTVDCATGHQLFTDHYYKMTE